MKKTLFISPPAIKQQPSNFKESLNILLFLVNHKDFGVVLPKTLGKGHEWYLENINILERICDIVDLKDSTNSRDNAYTTKCTDFILIKKASELSHYGGYIRLLDYSDKDFESHKLYTFMPIQTVGRKYLSIIATLGFDYDSVNIWIDNFLNKIQSTKNKCESYNTIACSLIDNDTVDLVYPDILSFITSYQN